MIMPAWTDRKDYIDMERATYRGMSKIAYIREYCHNKMSEFLKKNLPSEYEQTAYYDITYYYDDENRIMIESEYYLGD